MTSYNFHTECADVDPYTEHIDYGANAEHTLYLDASTEHDVCNTDHGVSDADNVAANTDFNGLLCGSCHLLNVVCHSGTDETIDWWCSHCGSTTAVFYKSDQYSCNVIPIYLDPDYAAFLRRNVSKTSWQQGFEGFQSLLDRGYDVTGLLHSNVIKYIHDKVAHFAVQKCCTSEQFGGYGRRVVGRALADAGEDEVVKACTDRYSVQVVRDLLVCDFRCRCEDPSIREIFVMAGQNLEAICGSAYGNVIAGILYEHGGCDIKQKIFDLALRHEVVGSLVELTSNGQFSATRKSIEKAIPRPSLSKAILTASLGALLLSKIIEVDCDGHHSNALVAEIVKRNHLLRGIAPLANGFQCAKYVVSMTSLTADQKSILKLELERADRDLRGHLDQHGDATESRCRKRGATKAPKRHEDNHPLEQVQALKEILKRNTAYQYQ